MFQQVVPFVSREAIATKVEIASPNWSMANALYLISRQEFVSRVFTREDCDVVEMMMDQMEHEDYSIVVLESRSFVVLR